jgi:hypothetical protein
MEEKQVYMSFEKEEYKQNKIELLKCRSEMILLQKNLQHLKAVRARKLRLVSELAREFSITLDVADKLCVKFPEQSLPKKIKEKMKGRNLDGKALGKKTNMIFSEQKEKKSDSNKQSQKSNRLNSDDFDKELFELNKKIKELEI